MSAELIEANQSPKTSLSCKVTVEMKGKFTLLAAEKGLNTNQLLAMLVKAAVDKKYESEIMDLNHELDAYRDQLNEKQGDLERCVAEKRRLLQDKQIEKSETLTWQKQVDRLRREKAQLLDKNTEIFQSLKKEDDDSFFANIPGWAWKKLQELPMEVHERQLH